MNKHHYKASLSSIFNRFTFTLKSIHTTSSPIQNTRTKLLSLHQQNSQSTTTQRLSSLLAACNAPCLVQQGKQVHTQVIVNGLVNDNQCGAQIMRMYVVCNKVFDASNLFYALDLKFTMPWNLMIRSLAAMGLCKFAILFYFKMLGYGVCPDSYTFPSVVKACSGLNNVKFGRIVHDCIREIGLEIDVFVGSALVKLYAENGCIEDARFLFDEMSLRDCVLWNAILNGYARCGKVENVVSLFQELRNSDTLPNSVTFVTLLSVCTAEGMINFGARLHGLVVRFGFEFNSLVVNSLVAMYSRCGMLSDARALFDLMPQTDLVTWNSMIAGYVQNGFMKEALEFLYEMLSTGVKPDAITFASFLPSVSESENLERGKEIHSYIVRHGVSLDVFLKSALIDFYFKCREVKMACNIFNQSIISDVGMCTAMISGLVLNELYCDALEIFRQLLQENMTPNALTFSSILAACAGLTALKLGKELHGGILRKWSCMTYHVGTAIMDLYAKCGRLDLALQFFERMPDRDAVCWNAMITNCNKNSQPEQAIDLFRQMGINVVKYDSVSMSASLSACATLPALHYGKEIHGLIIKGDFASDIFVESALIDMYAKCGNLNLARHVFDTMQAKNEVAWNIIIAAYGNHGHLNECSSLFEEMTGKGFQPDHVTFLSILSACGHAGQVNDGVHYFSLMTAECGIAAKMEHYACMVDLFGRAGLLTEAFETIKSMPFSPDAGVWGTLLGACRVHGNVELAEIAGKHLFNLDPQNSGYYVLLSNTLADAGDWASVLKVRSLMKQRGVQKVPGYSWIDVNNATHMFVAADESHPQSVQIYSLLKSLLLELRREGYVPKLYLPMHPQTLVSDAR